MGGMFVTIFIGVFVAIGPAVIGYGANSWRLAKQAENWPTAEGVIVARNLKVSTGEDGTTYRAEIDYAYSVGGQDYRHDKIAFGYAGSSAEKFHRDVYDALTVNTRILAVRYDPNEPSRAVLSYGVNRSIIALMVFGAIWTLFCAGFIVLLLMNSQGADMLLKNVLIYSKS